jgi:hypothetical protein
MERLLGTKELEAALRAAEACNHRAGLDLRGHIEALAADNAAYIHALNFIENDLSEGRADDAQRRAVEVLTPDHPGAALLERMRALEEALGEIATACEDKILRVGTEDYIDVLRSTIDRVHAVALAAYKARGG